MKIHPFNIFEQKQLFKLPGCIHIIPITIHNKNASRKKNHGRNGVGTQPPKLRIYSIKFTSSCHNLSIHTIETHSRGIITGGMITKRLKIHKK